MIPKGLCPFGLPLLDDLASIFLAQPFLSIKKAFSGTAQEGFFCPRTLFFAVSVVTDPSDSSLKVQTNLAALPRVDRQIHYNNPGNFVKYEPPAVLMCILNTMGLVSVTSLATEYFTRYRISREARRDFYLTGKRKHSIIKKDKDNCTSVRRR